MLSRIRGGLGDEGIDALVVRFARDVGDDLQIEASAEGDGVGPVLGEEPIVVATAVTEAAAIAGESEAGDEDEGDFLRCDNLLAGGGFAEGRIPGRGCEIFEMTDGDEFQLRADDARIAKAVAAVLP